MDRSTQASPAHSTSSASASASAAGPTPPHRLSAIIDALPLTVLTLVLAIWWLGWPGIANSDGEVPALTQVDAASAEQLEGVFTQAGYFWPSREIPPLALQDLPADLATIAADQRKSLFFRALLPMVLAENERISEQRNRLMNALDANTPRPRHQIVLSRLTEAYGVDGDPLAVETQAALKDAVDEVPVALALAQAAKESGWGTSRFAIEGNNLFGQWTWTASRGLKPKDRAEDATHYVRVFKSLRQSVRSYMHNLNSHDAYAEFRALRAQARAEGERLSPELMTTGLDRYSERGEAYVEEIQAMIHNNRLHWLVVGAQLVRDSGRLAAQ